MEMRFVLHLALVLFYSEASAENVKMQVSRNAIVYQDELFGKMIDDFVPRAASVASVARMERSAIRVSRTQ